MSQKHKTIKVIAFVILAIYLLPWAFLIAAAAITFFTGTDVGLFEATTAIYGIEAFLYTAAILPLVFMPVYIISAITAVISTVILILLKKKSASAYKRTPKVIMTCGRICSGKSTYAQKMRKERTAVILSIDEINLALSGLYAVEKHDEYVEKIRAYLFEKSVEIVETGINVVLDTGLWQRSEREYARKFYSEHAVACELHYIDISDEEWERRRQKRNEDIAAGLTTAYYIDEGLLAKADILFEPPAPDEVDVTVNA